MSDQTRRRGIALAGFGGAIGILGVTFVHYPIHEWLIWRYVIFIACAVFAALGWLGTGSMLVRRAFPTMPLRERWAVGFPLGFFLFEVAVFLAGCLDLYHPALFFVMPLLFFAAGGRRAWQDIGAWRRAGRRWSAQRAPTLGVVWVLGVVAALVLLLIYISILTPENVAFDARWRHLGLAEEWVARGGVERFPEGMTFAARPHFTSYLYTWCFLFPTGRLFDQIVLSAHIEFVIFLFTALWGIPALCRRLVPGLDPRLMWVWRFLFPGVLLYDSSLSASADHVGAAFCIPLALLVLRAIRRPNIAAFAALGITAGMIATTKYTAVALLLPGAVAWTAGALIVGAFRGRVTRDWRRWSLWAAAAVGGGLLTSAPHWVKNILWYRNPVYPLLADVFPSTPWLKDSSYLVSHYKEYQLWQPDHDWFGALESLGATFAFAFDPHDYSDFHGDVPVFGFLFTLSSILVFFVRKRGHVFPVLVWVHLGLFAWYWIHHQDRYLQTLMPLMAATTGALLCRAYMESGRLARTALGVLVATQIVVGADTYFIPAHRFTRNPPLVTVAKLFAEGFKGNYEQRLRFKTRWPDIAKGTPSDATFLLHEIHNSLGLSRPRVHDWVTWQFGLDYGHIRDAAHLFDVYRRYRVDHVAWRTNTSSGFDSLRGDIVFFDFARFYTERRQKFGSITRADIPEALTKFETPRYRDQLAMVLSCKQKRGYQTGIYPVSVLNQPSFGPRQNRGRLPKPRHAIGAAGPTSWRHKVRFIAVDDRCEGYEVKKITRGFAKLFTVKSALGQKNPRWTVYAKPPPRRTDKDAKRSPLPAKPLPPPQPKRPMFGRPGGAVSPSR